MLSTYLMRRSVWHRGASHRLFGLFALDSAGNFIIRTRCNASANVVGSWTIVLDLSKGDLPIKIPLHRKAELKRLENPLLIPSDKSLRLSFQQTLLYKCFYFVVWFCVIFAVICFCWTSVQSLPPSVQKQIIEFETFIDGKTQQMMHPLLYRLLRRIMKTAKDLSGFQSSIETVEEEMDVELPKIKKEEEKPKGLMGVLILAVTILSVMLLTD